MKDYQDLRIVFMGTPEFAVASLAAIVKAGCNIVAVVTAPDKPAGRGLKIVQSAVKKYAVENNLHVLQPAKLKDPAFYDELKALSPDVQIVVAFRMLPEIIWNLPPMGTINLHGSLLPHYRGAAPINWAIINGEKKTGVTTFKLKHEIDTGDILLQDSFNIKDDDSAGDVHDKMKGVGAALLVRTIKELAAGTLEEFPQEATEVKHAPKIHTDTCRINWSQPVEVIHNFVRGLSPYPGAYMVLNEKMFKIYKASKEVVFPSHTEGDYVTDGKTFLKFACANGYLHLLEVQLEGKKKMEITEFLRGYRIGGN